MINLSNYILEKFKLNSKNVEHEVKDNELNFHEVDIPHKLELDLTYKTAGDEQTHSNKMKAYHDKGSNPDRLVQSIKNEEKLLKRWLLTIKFDWEKAFIVFRDAIIKRGYFTKDELYSYIKKNFVDTTWRSDDIRNKYKKYLTL